jgi:nucleotide-binding universal stress UspA family protein
MPLAETALPLAGLLAKTLDAGLELLRVVPVESPSGAESHARAYLDRIASDNVSEGMVAEARVLRGSPADCIVREAAAQHVWLIVMTTHARSGLRRAALGSVAEHVVAHSPAPTVLLRDTKISTPRLRTLLMTVDGSCAAPLALITELAKEAGARVILLRVVAIEETYVWQWRRGPVLEEPQAVAIARQQLTDLVTRLRAAGVTSDAHVAIGSPAATIRSVAAEVDADLIAMATHARTGAERAMLGSVADAVVRTSGRPVLVCRLIPPPPGKPRPIDVVHELQHKQPRLVPLSIPEPQYRNIGLPRT